MYEFQGSQHLCRRPCIMHPSTPALKPAQHWFCSFSLKTGTLPRQHVSPGREEESGETAQEQKRGRMKRELKRYWRGGVMRCPRALELLTSIWIDVEGLGWSSTLVHLHGDLCKPTTQGWKVTMVIELLFCSCLTCKSFCLPLAFFPQSNTSVPTRCHPWSPYGEASYEFFWLQTAWSSTAWDGERATGDLVRLKRGYLFLSLSSLRLKTEEQQQQQRRQQENEPEPWAPKELS